jgi:hypothetical protein
VLNSGGEVTFKRFISRSFIFSHTITPIPGSTRKYPEADENRDFWLKVSDQHPTLQKNLVKRKFRPGCIADVTESMFCYCGEFALCEEGVIVKYGPEEVEPKS